MPEALVVPENEQLELGVRAPRELSAALETSRAETIGDLVRLGVTQESDVDELLRAAREVTRSALESPETFSKNRFVPGTRLTDLGRFPAVLAAASSVSPAQTHAFWRTVRDIEPRQLVEATLDTRLKVGLDITRWLFADVTVQPGATLVTTAPHAVLSASQLLIRRGGRIVSHSSSLTINASSIKGEE